jgi:hypothetical protein
VHSLSLVTVGEDRALRFTRSQLYNLRSGGAYRSSCVLSHLLRSEKTERCVSLTLIGANPTATESVEAAIGEDRELVLSYSHVRNATSVDISWIRAFLLALL